MNCLLPKRIAPFDYERRNLNYDNLLMITRLRLAGREGFEPSIPDPKSGALPLGDRPIPKLLERS
ncbi:MAG: hypothetical protein K0Q83_809 [Deltaproteobacteria bacterium]|jgi:hypothetical protein|nr:hypothetical protein [Deltaproteobacteria bacterium]